MRRDETGIARQRRELFDQGSRSILRLQATGRPTRSRRVLACRPCCACGQRCRRYRYERSQAGRGLQSRGLRIRQRASRLLRAKLVDGGTEVPRPPWKDGAASDAAGARSADIIALTERLLAGVSNDPEQRNSDQNGRWLLAQMLEYHRREHKVHWWEHYRLAAISTEEALDEKAAIGGLTFVEQVGASKKGLPIHRYSYLRQEHELHEGDELISSAPPNIAPTNSDPRNSATDADQDKKTSAVSIGDIVAVSRTQLTIDIQKAAKSATMHPDVVFHLPYIKPTPKPEALIRLATTVADDGFRRDGVHAAASLLLQRQPPQVDLARRPGEDTLSLARRVVLELDGDVLPIQGPPGTGKTHTAVQMICALVAAGRRVGVTATSHKVLRNLLDKVATAAKETSQPIRCMHKVGSDHTFNPDSAVRDAKTGKEISAALTNRSVDVVGGTPWLWASPDLIGKVDVLFIDEAGQMSLADTLAASMAARNLVLVGDPRQLDQPQQGSHPDGAEVSALGHLFGDSATIPDDAGIFLAETWRLAPAINAFTSELFYESRLQPRVDNVRQRISGTSTYAEGAGAGLWHIAVDHRGNQSSSTEEVIAVVAACDDLLRAGTTWTNREGTVKPLRPADILVVAPYNAQVNLLSAALSPRGVRIGTVDKFQGQEAPVAIYSMATSTPEDAPRGMEFLYSANRFNVATSRARCVCILVASPRLFEPECKTPRQMQLANAFCRYLEMATQG